MGEGDMSDKLNIYSYLVLGGALLLIIGCFLPVASVAGIVNVKMLDDGKDGAIIVGILVIFAAPLLFFGKYKFIIIPALLILAILLIDFFDIVGDDTGFIDLEIPAWIFLFVGNALLFASAIKSFMDPPMESAANSGGMIDIPND
jgi:hypothetical protein